VETPRLTNETHFEFNTENRDMFNRYGPQALGIEPFAAQYDEALANEDTALELVRKSAETPRIAVADAAFDDTFSGMHTYLQSCLKHYIPDMRRAAENLNVVFQKYGNIGKLAYREELAASHNLVQDLRAREVDVVATGLMPWLEAHEQAAANLLALLGERTGEAAQQTALRVAGTRRETDRIYQQILKRLEAMINIQGVDFVPGFVAEYNAHATEYKHTLAQHLGRIRVKNEE
jgi:hypothetical protein